MGDDLSPSDEHQIDNDRSEDGFHQDIHNDPHDNYPIERRQLITEWLPLGLSKTFVASLSLSALGSLLTGCGRRPAQTNQFQHSNIPVQLSAKAQRTGQLSASRLPAGMRYRVVSGDTISSIARRSSSSVSDIITANKLENNIIYPGQELVLPGSWRMGSDPLNLKQPGSQTTARSLPNYQPGGYRLVKRHQWTRGKLKKNQRAMNGIKRITLHHTGSHRGFIGKSDKEIVQMIERFHQQERKWAAIGYHFLIGQDGSVYEGRPVNVQGAHVSKHNSHNLGISVIGDYDAKRPNKQQLATLHAFIDAQRKRYGVSKKRVFGHKDLGKTVCPGRHLYRWLNNYKAS